MPENPVTAGRARNSENARIAQTAGVYDPGDAANMTTRKTLAI